MARPKKVKSVAGIRNLPTPKSGQVDHSVEGAPGLFVRASTSGAKSFVVLYRHRGQSRRDTIGRFDPQASDGETGSLKWAKDQAEHVRAQAANGVDPRREREAKRREAERAEANTYESVVASFIEKYAKPRQRTWKETERTLKTCCPDWHDRPFTEITRRDAQDVLDGFAAAGKIYKAANTRAWLRKLWRWAARRDDDLLPIMDALDLEFERRERERFYTDDEIKRLWKAADELDAPRGDYLKLMLLLAPRAKELAGLRFDELDNPDEPTLWTIPTSRTKTRKSSEQRGRVYLVPLPSLAARILKSMPRTDSGFAFPGRHHGKPLDPGTPFREAVRDKSKVADFKFHDCRRTIATWLQDQGYSEFERGLVLNHSESGVTAGYSRGYPLERKREVLEQWAAHVEAIAMPEGVRALR